MQPALFDSSIYISALRRGVAANPLRHSAERPLWLSAVVLEELYAGARGRDIAAIESLERGFAEARRIVVPNLRDWVEAGMVLARLAARYDYESIGRGRLTNDALIAVSAARRGIRLITANQRDFRRLAEFHDFEWELANP